MEIIGVNTSISGNPSSGIGPVVGGAMAAVLLLAIIVVLIVTLIAVLRRKRTATRTTLAGKFVSITIHASCSTT